MGRASLPPGAESKSNGYITIKQLDGSWVYKHHIVAKEKLGRDLHPTERVCFIDGDNRNFNPDNIEIRWKAPTKGFKRRAYLRRRILEARSVLNNLEEQLRLHEATMEDGPIAEPQEGRGGEAYGDA